MATFCNCPFDGMYGHLPICPSFTPAPTQSEASEPAEEEELFVPPDPTAEYRDGDIDKFFGCMAEEPTASQQAPADHPDVVEAASGHDWQDQHKGYNYARYRCSRCGLASDGDGDEYPSIPCGLVKDARSYLMSHNGTFPHEKNIAVIELALFAQEQLARQPATSPDAVIDEKLQTLARLGEKALERIRDAQCHPEYLREIAVEELRDIQEFKKTGTIRI